MLVKWLSPSVVFFLLACTTMSGSRSHHNGVRFFRSVKAAFSYTGRFFLEDAEMKAYAPGAYVTVGFRGTSVELEISDEKKFGAHNYIHVVIDDTIERRIQLTAHQNVIRLASDLQPGKHSLLICKDTESGMGAIGIKGISCAGVFKLSGKKRKIEFIGDSITCGNGADTSVIRCGDGTWYDQHNAFQAFGPRVARSFSADWILSSVSGIGMTRSCCGLSVTMPEVYDRVNFEEDGVFWKFPVRHPDAVVITLGQNDGIVDSLVYCRKYEQFVHRIRVLYPKTTIICCSSPMADTKLMKQMRNYIPAIEAELHKVGDLNVRSFIYSKNYRSGCFFHPTVQEHALIAAELIPFLEQTLGWK